MTRPELSAAIRALPEDEQLELLGELWDLIDQAASTPDWHREELERRRASADPAMFIPWTDVRARLLGSK